MTILPPRLLTKIKTLLPKRKMTKTRKQIPEAEKDKKDQIQKNRDAQKKEIADLQRNSISCNAKKLRAAADHGDAGTMLRDSAKYTEDSKKQQEEMQTKKTGH